MITTRRRFLATGAATAFASFAPRTFFGQETSLPEMLIQGRAQAATAKITTQKLRDNLNVLMGSGGNIAVLSGPQGKLLVDAGVSTSQPQITAALSAISADPVQHLINTHWHWDHTDGNPWLHRAGATIIAHRRTRERLSTPQTIQLFNAVFPPVPEDGRPTMVFTDADDLKLNGVAIALSHYDPAHTDTDISVYFGDLDVLHVGDTWFSGAYPFFDASTGGHIDGMIRATKKSLEIGTTSTIVIPGHGPVGKKTDLDATLEMLTTLRGKIADIKKQGKTVEEAVALKPTTAFDAKYGNGFVKPEMFVRLVYQGV
ncbi:MBL fold metallo-hydrolase [Edaphobacter flagellatus]|uniref:MBL fold metallo-hydrolase n=1 Tax=Edaphobacter flagellatus TaxID=1933044 RepID=UPI0021B30084|nr:MBL fold metallo-hydrolase [Edaphobacter flagellatus]